MTSPNLKKLHGSVQNSFRPLTHHARVQGSHFISSLWLTEVLNSSLKFRVCTAPQKLSPSCSSFAKHASLDMHFLFTAPGFYVLSLGNSLGVICGGKPKARPAADFRELSGMWCSCKTARPLLQLAEEHEAKRSTFLTEQPPKEEEEKHGMSESRLLFSSL